MKDKKILICKGQAGLGNRILCLLTCILYARLSNRGIVVDWRDEAYSDNKTNIFPYLFSSATVRNIDEIYYDDNINPNIWIGNLDLSVLGLCRKMNIKITKVNGPFIYRSYSALLKNTHYPENIVIFSSYTHKLQQMRGNFKGGFSHYLKMNNNSILRKLIHEELKPSDEVRNRVELFAKQYFKRPTVGVHIRYTDRTTPLDKFHSAIDKVSAKIKNMQVFLACDNKAVQRDLVSRYKNNIVTDKWLPKQGKRLHYNSNKPDNIQIAKEALIDMYLLSKCDYLIYPGRSSFSFISRILSDLPDNRIIDIDKWDILVRLKNTIQTCA